MYFKQIVVPGLGCFSYVIGCPGAKAMVVVDPKRDVQDYLDISRNEGMKISHIIDTHVHADHVSGGQELRSHTQAPIYLHEKAAVDYEHKTLKEGDIIEIGNARIKVLYTPGHTPNALSLLISDKSRSADPWMVLTGDLLFVNDIGRPDLAGDEILEEQVHNSYDLYNNWVPIPILGSFPAHGWFPGAAGKISSKTSSPRLRAAQQPPCSVFRILRFQGRDESAVFRPGPKFLPSFIQTNIKGAPAAKPVFFRPGADSGPFEEADERTGAVVMIPATWRPSAVSISPTP